MNQNERRKAIKSRFFRCTCGQIVHPQSAVCVTPSDDPSNLAILYCEPCAQKNRYKWRGYNMHHYDWTECIEQ